MKRVVFVLDHVLERLVQVLLVAFGLLSESLPRPVRAPFEGMQLRLGVLPGAQVRFQLAFEDRVLVGFDHCLFDFVSYRHSLRSRRRVLLGARRPLPLALLFSPHSRKSLAILLLLLKFLLLFAQKHSLIVFVFISPYKINNVVFPIQ